MTKISVENMGPIVSGEVDLKPLTIFIGPSNTGKSYLATAIYALMKAFEEMPWRLWSQPPPSRGRLGQGGNRYPFHLPSLDDEPGVKQPFSEWVSGRAYDVLDLDALTVSRLPIEVQLTLPRFTLNSLDFLRDDVLIQFHQTFGDTSVFVNRHHGPEHFRLNIKRDNPLLQMDIRLTDGMKNMHDIDISQAKAPTPGVDLRASNVKPYEDALHWLWNESVYGMRDSVAEALTEGIPSRSFYVPAARSGIAQGHKVLAASLVRQSARIGSEPVSISTLTRIATEFLSNLISLDRRTGNPRVRDELTEAVDFIENEVLHGRIDLDESGGLPYPGIVYEPMDTAPDMGTFTLDHISSMVSELAPVTLFLKYLVRPGDLLILEEPESHPHPTAQRQMARGIVRLVNAGVKVLITTRSDLLLAAINNLLRPSFAGRDKLTELGFEREDCLSHDDVSAYRFGLNEAAGGSFVHELEIRRDVGTEDEEFGRVVNELYDETIAVEQIPIE